MVLEIFKRAKGKCEIETLGAIINGCLCMQIRQHGFYIPFRCLQYGASNLGGII